MFFPAFSTNHLNDTDKTKHKRNQKQYKKTTKANKILPSSHETDRANSTAPHGLHVYCDYCNAAAGTTLSK